MMVAMWGLNAAENPWQTQAFCDFVVLLFRRVPAATTRPSPRRSGPGSVARCRRARLRARAVGDARPSLGGDDDGAARSR